MPTHRGVVIRADHSGFGSAAGLKRLPATVYRAVLADKVFKGSLESVMQQIDDALGSTPTARIPVPMPTSPKKNEHKSAAKKSPTNQSAANKSAARQATSKRKASRPQPKKASRPGKKKAGRR